MKKRRGKGFTDSLGQMAYENKKLNHHLLELKKNLDDMNALLKTVKGKR